MSASRLYPQAFADLQSGSLDWTTLSVKGILLSEAFSYDSSLIYRDELNESFVIATSSEMVSPTFSNSVAGGLPIEWLQIADNRRAHHIVLFDDTGDDAYSPLIAYLSADCVEGLDSPIDGANYYLYPVQPPGGYFSYGLASEVIGPVNTYSLAYNLALAESEGGAVYSIPILVFGLEIAANPRICLLPDALDVDQCGPPTIRSSLCD